MFIRSKTIINNPVSLRRISGEIVTRIFHQIKPVTSEMSRSGKRISFFSFWERKSGNSAPRLIPIFPS